MKSLILAFFAWLLLLASPISYASLSQFYTKTGKITVSVDGAGSVGASHIAEVEKLSATTVVSAAYVMASAIGNNGISDGDISINDNAINWDETITFGTFTNVRADVTDIVKPIVDASSAGRISFTFTEINKVTIDGETLVVVFDDPAQITEKTVSLFFGIQNSAGDSFSMELVKPGGSQANVAVADFGVAIGFGFQGTQFNVIDINGTRLTSSAGGQDDGDANNGALITVGGLEDRNDNPVDPNAQPNGDSRIDDELYTLLPFINNDTSSLLVETENLNDDDNIYFSYLVLSSAEEGGEITLLPETTNANVGDSIAVTATLLTSSGTPISGGTVNFNVSSGPNSGSTFTAISDTHGKANITYSSTLLGTDEIYASSSTVTSDSNAITVVWSEVEPVSEISLMPEIAAGVVGNDVIVTATLLTSSGIPVADEEVEFNVSSGPNSGNTYLATSDANGKTSITYSSNSAGTDEIDASSSTITSNTISVVWSEIVQVSGISLMPETTSAAIGENITMTATLLTSSGVPVSGEEVNFNITSGPNSGSMYAATSDVNGKANVTYSSSEAGPDQIHASSSSVISNTSTVVWTNKEIQPPAQLKAEPIPTLSEWSILLMVLLLSLIAIRERAKGHRIR